MLGKKKNEEPVKKAPVKKEKKVVQFPVPAMTNKARVINSMPEVVKKYPELMDYFNELSKFVTERVK